MKININNKAPSVGSTYITHPFSIMYHKDSLNNSEIRTIAKVHSIVNDICHINNTNSSFSISFLSKIERVQKCSPGIIMFYGNYSHMKCSDIVIQLEIRKSIHVYCSNLIDILTDGLEILKFLECDICRLENALSSRNTKLLNELVNRKSIIIFDAELGFSRIMTLSEILSEFNTKYTYVYIYDVTGNVKQYKIMFENGFILVTTLTTKESEPAIKIDLQKFYTWICSSPTTTYIGFYTDM